MCLNLERMEQGFVIAPQGGDTSVRVSLHICAVGRGGPAYREPLVDLEKFRHPRLLLIASCFLRKILDGSLVGFPGALGSAACG